MADTAFNKNYIESKDWDDNKFSAEEFYSLIKDDKINREKILDWLRDDGTKDKLIMLYKQSSMRKQITDKIKSDINLKTIDWKDKGWWNQATKDAVELCFLWWFLSKNINPTWGAVEVNNASDDNFITKAKEYYTSLTTNTETKETVKETDVLAEGTNKVATTEITRTNNNDLSEISTATNISSASITVEAGASAPRMNESRAYKLFQNKISGLKKLKAKFVDSEEIDNLITELWWDKGNIDDLKVFDKVKEIIWGDNNQTGNAILILARLTEGFIQSLTKIETKAKKNANWKALVTLTLEVNRTECKINSSNKWKENDADRYVNIKWIVESVTDTDKNTNTNENTDDKKTTNNKTENDDKNNSTTGWIETGEDNNNGSNNEKEKDKEEKTKWNKETNQEQVETRTLKNQDPRRLIIAETFNKQVDTIDNTWDTRAIAGYTWLKFSRVTEENAGSNWDKKITFTLNAGTATKGRLNYTVVKTNFEAIKHEDWSYTVKSNLNLDNAITLDTNTTALWLPQGVTLKNITQDELILTYTKTWISSSTTPLELSISLDPLTGKLKHPTADADNLASLNSERVDVTPSTSPTLEHWYTSDGAVKILARETVDGKLEIVTNIKKDRTYIDNAYGEYESTIEDYNEAPQIFFHIYQSTKNDSSIDKTAFTSWKSLPQKNSQNKIIPGSYVYQTTIPSNSGAETYNMTIPYTVKQATNTTGWQRTNTFDISKLKITKKRKKIDPIDGTYDIDGVFYTIQAEWNSISMKEKEAETLQYYTKIHPSNEHLSIQDQVPQKYEKVNKNVVWDPKIEASTYLPTGVQTELIINKASDDKLSTMTQSIKVWDKAFDVHYDEQGELTYITESWKDDKKRLAWWDLPQVTIENYLGGKSLTLQLKSKGKNITIAPVYTKENWFEKASDIAEQILQDKKAIYNAFGENIWIVSQDKQYFQLPKSSNVEQSWANLDTDRGDKPYGKSRIKGPDRKGIYTVTVIKSQDRWSHPNSKRSLKPDFELHFKVWTDGKLQMVGLDWKDVKSVKMPLENPMDTKLNKNYKFSITDTGKLKAAPEDKVEMTDLEFLHPGTEVNITGEPKQIQTVIQSTETYSKVLFADGTRWTLFMNKKTDTDTETETYTWYRTLEGANDSIESQEGQSLNTLFKNTLVQKLKTMNIHGLGYNKETLSNYIATLGPDLELLKAIAWLSEGANNKYDFVPLVVDNRLEMWAIKNWETINNISEVEKRNLRDAKLERLITQIAYLKKAEDIKLDYANSKEVTSGLFMYSDKDTFENARKTILSQGMTENAVLNYKLSNGTKTPVEVKITMWVQSGQRFTVTNNPISLDGRKYTLSYHRKTKRNGKEQANTLTIDRAERIENASE